MTTSLGSESSQTQMRESFHTIPEGAPSVKLEVASVKIEVAAPVKAAPAVRTSGGLMIPPPPSALLDAMHAMFTPNAAAGAATAITPQAAPSFGAPVASLVTPALVVTAPAAAPSAPLALAPSAAPLPLAVAAQPFALKPAPPIAPMRALSISDVSADFAEFTDAISDEGSLPPVAMTNSDLPAPTIPRMREMRDVVESMFFWDAPEDPVLTQKREPEVQMRRARFQRYVKATVGGCAGMCLLALVCSLFTGGSANASEAVDAKAGIAHVAHNAKTTVETFDATSTGKAPRTTHAARARSSARR